MAHRAFVAFSGGGAKGIVHVGALKALELRNVEILGVSGTSAGAIVAALAASGFRADDIVDGATGSTILRELSIIDPRLRRAVDLFGGQWWRIRLLRAVLTLPMPLGWTAFLTWVALLLLGWGLQALLPSSVTFLFWLGYWLILGIAAFVISRVALGGLSDIRRFRDALNRLLQRKMFPDEAERTVLLEDFGKEGRPTLKIVSANLSQHSLHLFSPERTPKMPLADAVAASVCLPVVFSPWQIAQDLHVDGGIVSNLPAWSFDEERELDPEALTIAVEVEVQPESAYLNRFNWVPAAIRTGLFGSGELNLRISGPSEKLALPTKFGLLDFDKSAEATAAEVREVAAAAGTQAREGA
ncbi:NTE family protein [Enhydrobacter aerosaccus]|uniref:NTE family protein n=1 Tax=Enhydrobacter aerosaccus TaxID=225324 RepID=A0A1T4R6C0_9HYPH|nr:patatin-like phospholipase family protein [Enhydrobacter aerosaccus]SKA11443.1 NTE family protein [Enhydrobacter aerosaccus]